MFPALKCPAISPYGIVRRIGLLIAAVPAVTVVASGCSKTNTASTAAGATNTGAVTGPTGAAQSGSGSASASPSGQCPTSNTTAFAKTKFVAHTGLAFGAFHRYLWKPYRAGTFSSGAHGRIIAFVKGGLAAALIAHEVHVASRDVQANPTLCHLIAAPLAKVGDLVSSAVTKIKGGDPSGLTAVNDMIGSVTNSSATQGVPIQEDPNPSLTG